MITFGHFPKVLNFHNFSIWNASHRYVPTRRVADLYLDFLHCSIDNFKTSLETDDGCIVCIVGAVTHGASCSYWNTSDHCVGTESISNAGHQWTSSHCQQRAHRCITSHHDPIAVEQNFSGRKNVPRWYGSSELDENWSRPEEIVNKNKKRHMT